MKKLTSRLSLGCARIAAPTLIYRPRSSQADYDLNYNAYSQKVQGAIESGSPFLSARLGSVEALACLSQIWEQNASALRKAIAAPYLRQLRLRLGSNAGVFPNTDEQFHTFCAEYLDSLKSIDILASWIQQEDLLDSYFTHPQTVFLENIVPFVGDNPWSATLAGKQVLVVHPFAQSIETQYAQRELLFADAQVLPRFDLIAYPAVQSIGGQVMQRSANGSTLPDNNMPANVRAVPDNRTVSYFSWTEALAQMKTDIAALDFDVAILGCGAYGLPLAAHVKALGKPAIHLGGVTQCLFGIKGRRWAEDYGWDKLYFNEHWIYPDASERPASAQSVENACYWAN